MLAISTAIVIFSIIQNNAESVITRALKNDLPGNAHEIEALGWPITTQFLLLHWTPCLKMPKIREPQ